MILIKPARTKPLTGTVLLEPTMSDINRYLPEKRNGLLAFDYETNGVDDDAIPVGVAMVDSYNPSGIYFSFKRCSPMLIDTVLQRIAKRPTIVHNAQFEQKITKNFIGDYANIHYDTLALLNQTESDWKLENSGSLKNLQVDLLSWEFKGDVELDAWLVENGYADSRGKPLKGEMHRAPDEILGKYACWDAQATWDLYWEVFRPVLDRFPELDMYHTRDFQNLVTLINEARLSGLTVDRQKLKAYAAQLEAESAQLMEQFFKDSPATPHILEYNKSVVRQHFDKIPPKKTKTGKVSVRYQKWKEKLAALQQENHFNPNSKQQLAYVFENLYNVEIKEVYRNGKKIKVAQFFTEE